MYSLKQHTVHSLFVCISSSDQPIVKKGKSMPEHDTTPKKRKVALISVWDKTPAVAEMAKLLYDADWHIVASKGTKDFLESDAGGGIKVTETAEFTGLKPVLRHRVVTLAPQLHGGLLAELEDIKELEALGWPQIDMVAVTFYPMLKVMQDPKKSAAQINEAVDIGGPTLGRSACKGGRVVLTQEEHFVRFARVLAESGELPKNRIRWLHAVAIATISQYVAAETLFRLLQVIPEE